jgi:hypothetical protein
MNSVFHFLMVVVFSGSAWAVTPESILSGATSPLKSTGQGAPEALNLSISADYQIGEEWGKKPVRTEDIQSDPRFARMALATARVRDGGTGFYIGEFSGQHLVATNYHVCPSVTRCVGAGMVNFPLLGIRAEVVETIGTWSAVEVAFLVIRLPSASDAARLREVAQPFQFDSVLARGQKLTTMGFGVANNPARQLVANRDSDCIVFSGEDETRFMGDPDEFNPGDYKVWSFANGCDVSHGDSGSAMMDRETGRVIGIIWTGKIPKNPKVRSSAYLRDILTNPSEDIWRELSYGVPARNMKSYLEDQLATGAIVGRKAEVVRAVLQ